MAPCEAEVYDRLRTVETSAAVHGVELEAAKNDIHAIKSGMTAMEDRIVMAGKEREAHIVEKIGDQKRLLNRILWAVVAAGLSLLGNFATSWVKSVDRQMQVRPSQTAAAPGRE